MTIAQKMAIAMCVSLIVFALGTPVLGAVVINELMADPETDWNSSGVPNYRDDEWVEVYNNGTGVENLAAYYLRDITDDTPHLQMSGLLQPGQVMVFYGGDAVAWQQDNDVTVSGLSLNNTGDTVEVVFWDGIDYRVIDSVSYTDHEAEDERSSGRDPLTGAWTLYDGLNPHTGSQEPLGSGCLPSPGAPNDCPPLVPVKRTSWDGLKSLYR